MGMRLAKHSDLNECIDIGEEFWNTTEFDMAYDRAGVLGLLVVLIQARQFIVYEYEGEIVGVAAVLVTPFHFNPKITVATDVFWYVRPGVRANGVGEALLGGMEDIAKKKGAVLFSMGTLHNPEADDMLTKRDYKLTERSYSKVLECL